MTQVLGFYPGSGLPSGAGIMVDDGGHEFDASYTITVDETQFNNALNYIENEINNGRSYQLLTYNCTTSAIIAMIFAGANLPDSRTNGLIEYTPGYSGQVFSGASTISGAAPESKGPCH